MHFQAKSPLKPAGNRHPVGPVAMAMDSDSMTRLSGRCHAMSVESSEGQEPKAVC